MGMENMRRRWPVYVVLAVCITLLLSVMNNWSIETELRTEIGEISTQLKQCSAQQSGCSEELSTLIQQKQALGNKVKDLEQRNDLLTEEIDIQKDKVSNVESKVNNTQTEVKNCKLELESLKNLKVTYTATLDALRLKEEELSKKLKENNKVIDDLGKEIERLKSELLVKNTSIVSKVTPGDQMPKISPPLKAEPANEPALENAAKEEDDSNVNEGLPNDIDGNDFDPSLN